MITLITEKVAITHNINLLFKKNCTGSNKVQKLIWTVFKSIEFMNERNQPCSS